MYLVHADPLHSGVHTRHDGNRLLPKDNYRAGKALEYAGKQDIAPTKQAHRGLGAIHLHHNIQIQHSNRLCGKYKILSLPLDESKV